MKTLCEFIADCLAGKINGANYYGDTFGVQPAISEGHQVGWEFAVPTASDPDDPNSLTGFAYGIPNDVVIGESHDTEVTISSDLGNTWTRVVEDRVVVSTTDLNTMARMRRAVDAGAAELVSDEPAKEVGDPQYGTYTVRL